MLKHFALTTSWSRIRYAITLTTKGRLEMRKESSRAKLSLVWFVSNHFFTSPGPFVVVSTKIQIESSWRLRNHVAHDEFRFEFASRFFFFLRLSSNERHINFSFDDSMIVAIRSTLFNVVDIFVVFQYFRRTVMQHLKRLQTLWHGSNKEIMLL